MMSFGTSQRREKRESRATEERRSAPEFSQLEKTNCVAWMQSKGM
jgi:hypothetical protein